jgi:thiol:disulfide interchange protein DsbD
VDFSNLTQQLSAQPLLAIAVVFLAGVLTSLTPCIFPMIPITVAIVGGQTVGGAPPPRWRAAALTLTYVLGLALVYAALGLFAGLTGTMFGAVSTNPWLYFAMANLLIIAALIMLDVLPVPIPASVIARASTAGTGGRFSGAVIMGSMSGLVAAPCGAPVFAAVLTWVTATKSAGLGFLYLFVFSLGMSSLLIIVGIFSGALARLPRPGAWMLWVKRGFALVMLGAAEYYLIKMGQLWI